VNNGILYNALKRITPLRVAVRAVRGVLSAYRPSTWLLTGKERWTGHPLSLVFAGQLESKNYLAHLAFAGLAEEISLGRVWIWRALRLGERRFGHVPLTFVETRQHVPRGRREPGNFWVPCWVGCEVDIASANARIKKSRNIKRDLQRIDTQGLSYKTTKEPSQFERFYHEMYVPYIRNVYGERAFLMGYEEMMSKAGQCELLLVEQEGECLAGEIILFEKGRARAWSVGVKDGSRAFVRQGVLKVCEYFEIQHLSERGYKKIHWGASRPFLRDGALRHKKAWGVRIVDNARTGFAVKVPRRSPGVEAFLKNNPFIYRVDGAYHGAVFRDDLVTAGSSVQQLDSEYYIDGLRDITIFQLASEVPNAIIPGELAPRVKVRSAEPVFHP
jgi:hypothetical protein